MKEMNEVLREVVRLATHAILTYDDDKINAAIKEIHGLTGEGKKTTLEFSGIKLKGVTAPGMDSHYIGKRVTNDAVKPVRIYDIKVRRGHDGEMNHAVIRENDTCILSLDSAVNFSFTNQLAISLLRRLLELRTKANRRKYLKRKNQRALKRLEEDDLAERMENA